MPFQHDHFPVFIKAKARELKNWQIQTNAASQPPQSPLPPCSGSNPCGPIEDVLLVPYGTSRIRITGFPWFDVAK